MNGFLELLSTGLSIGSGGILGLVASGFSAFFKARQVKIDREWQLTLMVKSAELNINLADSEGRWNGLSESVKADASTSQNIGRITANLKALFRPALTIGLWGMSAWIFNELLTSDQPLANMFSAVEVKDLMRYMVYTTFFTAATSASWWFGDRALAPPRMK